MTISFERVSDFARAWRTHVFISAVGVWLLPAAAMAADAVPVPEAATSGKVEVVVITAERRDTNLQEAPVAAVVLSGDALEARNITGVDDLEFATPSLTVSQNGQSNQINIRGIGKEDNSGTATSAVATYRDGVGTISGFATGEPYYDIASIEVLRGPQGTFVGENAAGGAVFVNTRDPEVGGKYDGWVELGAGDYNEQKASGALNLPINDTFAARIAFNHVSHDSYYKAYFNDALTIKNKGLNDVDYNSYRVGLRWIPDDSWDIKFKYDYNNIDNNGYAFSVVPGYPTGLTPAPTNLSSDGFTIGNNSPNNYARDQIQRGILDIHKTFSDGLVFRSVSGAQDLDTWIRNDDDGSLQQDRRQDIRGVFKIYTQEFSLLSPVENRFNWIVGAYYRDETLDFPTDDGFFLYDFTTLNPGGGPEQITIKWHTPRQTAAAYGQVSYDLTDALKLQVGARYTHFHVDEECYLGLPVIFPGFVLPDFASYSEDKVTGKVALNWQVTPNNYFYAFVATGNTTGGVSVVLGTPDFRNQETTDYEAGWKGTLVEGSLYTQFGGFYDSIDHYQAYFYDKLSGRQTYQNLDGTSRIYGSELQLQAVMGNFSFDTGAAYIHSELGSALILDPDTNATIQTKGNQQPYTPEYTFFAGMQYNFHLWEDAVLTPRVDYSWIDQQTATPLERPFDKIDSHEQLNLRLELAMHNWDVIGYMKNATDENYIEAHGGPGYNAYVNPPRTWGVKVNYTF